MVNYFRDVFLGVWTALISMGVTFKHIFGPNKGFTIQYPRQKVEPPDRARHLLFNKIEDCIGCDQCVRACPVDCITLETVKADPDEDLGTTTTGHKKRLWVTVFDIDMAKCCYCQLCVYPCPTECLVMTKEYEHSVYNRDGLIFNFADLQPEKVQELRKREAERKAEEAKKKAAAAAAKKAPSPAAGA